MSNAKCYRNKELIIQYLSTIFIRPEIEKNFKTNISIANILTFQNTRNINKTLG